MKRLFIPLLMVAAGLALTAAALFASSPVNASTDTTTAAGHYRPPLHGTPDPNATPSVDGSGSTIDNPTYYADIEPILAQSCISCHVEGEIGHAFFPMDNVSDITDPDNAEYIAFVTGIGYMPPWPPGPDSLPMAHERSLTEDEIAMIAHWAEDGAPLGDEADRNLDAIQADVPEIREDLALQLPEYTPTGEILDDYRCFMVDPGFTEDTYITGTQLVPGNPEIAHHAIYFLADAAMVAEAATVDGADGLPGWPCYGGPNLNGNGNGGRGELRGIDQGALIAALNAQGVDIPTLLADLQAYQEENPNEPPGMGNLVPIFEANGVDVQQLIIDLDIDVADMISSGMGSSLGGWVPGAVPVTSPDNTGLLIPAGSQIVVQMHYNLYTTLGSDQSTLILETEPYSDDITPIRPRSLVAPVEIPCPEGVDSPECDRDQIEGTQTSDMLLVSCNQTLDTYADNTAENAYSYCDYPITFDGWLLSLGPHMHELGSASTITLNPGTDDEQVLIDIPDWDFHWQGQYDFATPVELQPGDTIRVECWWDNSDGERYVVWGEGTQDEMCFHFTRFLPREAGATLADYGYDMPGDDMSSMDGMHDHSDHDHSDHDHSDHDHSDHDHSDHDHGDGDHDHGDHGDHDHERMVEVSEGAPVPAVALTVTPTNAGGYFVQLEVENFDFAPEAVDGPHVEGQGHAHLYVNGEKITRLYSTEYYLESLPAGEVAVRVTLNANDHATYAHNGEMIADEVTVQVE